MENQLFVPFASSNGVPQESKLATYMNNRQSSSTPVAIAANVVQSFAKITLESPITSKKVMPQSPEFIPSSRAVSSSNSASPNLFTSFAAIGPQVNNFNRMVDSPHSGTASPHLTPQPSPPPNLNNCSPIQNTSLEKPTVATVAYQENVGGTTYFYPTSGENSHNTNDSLNSLNSSLGSSFHMYPGTPSHINTMKARASASTSSFFIAEDTRMELLNRNSLTLVQADPEQFSDLPQEVDNYHDLCPLEPIIIQKPPMNSPMGYAASMYKATHSKTGVRYCLRRIHGFRLQTKCTQYVDAWKKLCHSNIVQLKEVFTTKAFSDNSMVFVYDYHPGSETLLNKHFSPDQVNGYTDPFAVDQSPRPYSQQKNNILRHTQNNKLSEQLIWNYIIQLTSALRLIHLSAGLACRSLDPTKIIITSGHRLRLSCLGIMDVILTDTAVDHFQQEDLTALGKLVLALACKSTMAVQAANINTAVEIVTRSYTQDLRNLIMYLLTNRRRSVTDLMPMIGARFYTQLDSVQLRCDLLENEVAKEMENGRLFRLMVKLGTINERPELNMDGTWAETGNRYMLKLFRDYVFHQVTEEGRSWLDMAHVIQCLNKLDSGVPEKVCLMSRCEQSILVVSYQELKHCLEDSFNEILSASVAPDNVT